MASGGDKVPLTVYLTPEDKAKLERMAKLNDRTPSAEARRVITFHIRQHPLP